MHEIRSCPCELELRAEDGERPVVRGYAAVFEKLSEPMWGFREKIAPGAFKNSLAQRDVLALWNHNSDYPLGSVRSGGLTVEEDEKGLRFELTLPDTSWGRDALESIRAGLVRGMSFGFRCEKATWEGDVNNAVRTLRQIDLREISPTPFPAYPQTNVSVRALDRESIPEVRAYEDYIRTLNDASCAQLEMRRRYLALCEAECGV